MRRLTWVALAGSLLGCQDKGDAASAPEPPPQQSARAAQPTLPAATAADSPPDVPDEGGFKGGNLRGPNLPRGQGQSDAPIPQAAFTLPNVQDCQSNCIESNRMNAIGPEKLEADCKEECKSSCLAQCGSQTDAGKKACKVDCERQAARVR